MSTTDLRRSLRLGRERASRFLGRLPLTFEPQATLVVECVRPDFRPEFLEGCAACVTQPHLGSSDG